MNIYVSSRPFFAPQKGSAKTLEIFDEELQRYVPICSWGEYDGASHEFSVEDAERYEEYLAAGHRVPFAKPYIE